MPCGHEEVAEVVPDHGLLHARRGGEPRDVPVVRDGHVDGALGDQVHGEMRVDLGEPGVEGRMPDGQIGQYGGQQPACRTGERGEVQPLAGTPRRSSSSVSARSTMAINCCAVAAS